MGTMFSICCLCPGCKKKKQLWSFLSVPIPGSHPHGVRFRRANVGIRCHPREIRMDRQISVKARRWPAGEQLAGVAEGPSTLIATTLSSSENGQD